MTLLSLRKKITNTSRFLVGVLFIISGLIKANDTTGFGYKLDEYWDVFHITFLTPLSVYFAMLICIIEIGLGISLLLGTYRKITLNLLILMIVFFTFLTFYSAYFDKVKECGCFGDALKMTPWQSFGKDIFLCILIGILWVNRTLIEPLWIEDQKGEMTLYGGVIVATVFTLYCWYYLPVKDFLPYAVGKDIKKQMTLPKGAKSDSFAMKFIYEKAGKEYFISMPKLDSFTKLPDFSTYKFKDRKDVLIRKGDEPAIHDFVVYGEHAGQKEDMTQDFLTEKGYRLMIIQQILEKSNTSAQKDVNKMVSGLYHTPVKIWGLTSSSSDQIASYIKENNLEYKFFTADGTTLKTMIRANPGILMLKDNLIIGKWPATMCPSAREILTLSKNP